MAFLLLVTLSGNYVEVIGHPEYLESKSHCESNDMLGSTRRAGPSDPGQSVEVYLLTLRMPSRHTSDIDRPKQVVQDMIM